MAATPPSSGELLPARDDRSSRGRKRSEPKGLSSGIANASVPLVAGQGGCRSFSQLLAGAMAGSPALLAAPMLAVPRFLAPAAMLDAAAMTGPFLMTHQAVLATVTAQAQLQLLGGPQPPFPPVSPEPLRQQSLPNPEENVTATDTVAGKQKQMTNAIIKTAASDGYNWRKYGQKSAKNGESLRSYYRCTEANCSAKKKVAHFVDGHVADITYQGEHNHEYPKRLKFSRVRENMDTQTWEPRGSLPESSKMEQNSGRDFTESLNGTSDDEVDDRTEPDKDIEEPVPKKLMVEEQNVLVKNDVYRWRKYGQKNIKGSPNPRSYYRCTHAGCPARKHVEKSCYDSKATIVTYEGKHEHESERPKSKREMLPAGPPLETPAATTGNKQDSTLNPYRPLEGGPQHTGLGANTQESQHCSS